MKRIWKVAGTLVLTVLMIVGAQTAAQADASGSQSWGKICVAGYCIPNGVLHHRTVATGTTLYRDNVQFETWSGSVCNWQIEIQLRELGRLYNSRRGPLHSYCTWGVSFTEVFEWHGWKVPPSTDCAILLSNGIEVARQCHSISNR